MNIITTKCLARVSGMKKSPPLSQCCFWRKNCWKRLCLASSIPATYFSAKLKPILMLLFLKKNYSSNIILFKTTNQPNKPTKQPTNNQHWCCCFWRKNYWKWQVKPTSMLLFLKKKLLKMALLDNLDWQHSLQNSNCNGGRGLEKQGRGDL